MFFFLNLLLHIQTHVLNISYKEQLNLPTKYLSFHNMNTFSNLSQIGARTTTTHPIHATTKQQNNTCTHKRPPSKPKWEPRRRSTLQTTNEQYQPIFTWNEDPYQKINRPATESKTSLKQKSIILQMRKELLYTFET